MLDSSESRSGDSPTVQPTRGGQSSAQETALNPKENFPLLNTACAAVRYIQQRDYAALAGMVHPQRGLTVTPYSTVDTEVDLVFSAAQVKSFAQDTTRYSWGLIAGSGELIQMTPAEFFSGYLYNVDYTQATKIGVDRINISGNALENVTEVYPDCRFVEFTNTGTDAAGQDWSSLKLVFAPGEKQWLLVGLIHSQWTM